MSFLPNIHTPADVRALPPEALAPLAQEIRDRVIEVCAHNGGHIGPNLGVVELTIGLHRVFETPRDRFVFDVSHQGYVHKLLTGRNTEAFDHIRQTDGLSGFLNRFESEHDAYGAGHAGTALSAALGMAAARDRAGDDYHVVALLGDAAFTCGITLEALNNVAGSTKRLVMILNDNEWSIAKNVGALSKYFNQIITNPAYTRANKDLKTFLERMPGGDAVLQLGRKWKKETKDFFIGSSLFETFGVRYIGPIDGHDQEAVIKHLEFAKQSDVPLILHVITTKGKGYEPALAQPEKFHGLGPFNITTGKGPPKKEGTPPNYQDAFGQNLLKFAEEDEKIVGITAAMPPGTGLSYLREARPQQFFDVGIAEEHAVLFAAGLACAGQKPVVAIYSTFLQRAYDPIIHDICLQNLPVVFCMDRAGLSPNDGATHHGLFDLAYLRCVPNTIVMQDEDELADMLWTALNTPSPTFIRYPRGASVGVATKAKPALLEIGKAEVMQADGEIIIWALGPWLADMARLAPQIAERTGASVGLVNPRFVKPLDTALLQAQAATARLFVTAEDHVVTGGLGSAVVETLAEGDHAVPVVKIGYPDRFIDHATSGDDLRKEGGIDDANVVDRIVARWEKMQARRKAETAIPAG